MFIAVFLLQKQVSAVEYENLKRIYRCYFKRLIQDRHFNAALCGQAMSVQRNTKGRSRNRCCSGKIVSYFTCVSLTLVTQHNMRRIVIFGLPGSTILDTLSHNGTIFGKRYWTQNVCFSCSPKLLCETFLYSTKNSAIHYHKYA